MTPNVRVVDAELNIKLHANQKVLHESPALYKTCKCGKRFGKTKWAIFEIARAAGKGKAGDLFAYICPTYRQAKQIAWWELKQIIPTEFVKKWLESELEVELVTGARIKLFGAENPDFLRGLKFKGAIFDECAYIDEDVWVSIVRGQLLGTLTEKPGFAYFISSPNNKGRNWFSNFFDEAMRKMKNGDPDWAAFYFTIRDNPMLNPVEIDKMQQDTPEDKWNLEYMAIESLLAGQLYHEFDGTRNVGEYAGKEMLPVYRGIDWGLTHPTAVLWARVDFHTKEVFVYQEFVKSGQIIQEICQTVNKMSTGLKEEWTVIDPSAARKDQITGRSLKDEFSRHGVPCVPGDNRDRGYDIVKMFLKKGLLIVSPRCRQLLYELKNVQYGDKEGEDTVDCLRYLLVRIHDLTFAGNVFEIETNQKYESQTREVNFNDTNLFPEPRVDTNSWIMEEVA